MKYNTRIAPSPTGDFHLGTARTAYFNWLVAKSSGGKFQVRIDDTDVERNQEAAVQPIFDCLDWLGLSVDSTFKQSGRILMYKNIAKLLVEKGFAFELDNGAILLKWNRDLFPTSWVDEIGGRIQITENDIKNFDNQVLLRGDDKHNLPTYHFASTVDDYVSMVNYVIRGSDHITNTARHVGIWTALSSVFDDKRELPKFAHLGLIFANGKKLSKRDGAASMLTYKNAGVHPEAMLNFLLRLGWGPTVDDKSTTLLPVDRALELFLTGGKMKSSHANADFLKLDSFDRKYKGRDEHARRNANK